jgi:prefoldin subunit 5
MSTVDEINKAKQRISDALARINAQHDKLASQLSDLEAAERVLTRYSKGTLARNTASTRTQSEVAPFSGSGVGRG